MQHRLTSQVSIAACAAISKFGWRVFLEKVLIERTTVGRILPLKMKQQISRSVTQLFSSLFVFYLANRMKREEENILKGIYLGFTTEDTVDTLWKNYTSGRGVLEIFYDSEKLHHFLKLFFLLQNQKYSKKLALTEVTEGLTILSSLLPFFSFAPSSFLQSIGENSKSVLPNLLLFSRILYQLPVLTKILGDSLSPKTDNASSLLFAVNSLYLVWVSIIKKVSKDQPILFSLLYLTFHLLKL